MRSLTLLEIAIVVLGATRAVRLVVADTLTEPLRLWIVRRSQARAARVGSHAWLAKLVTCPWCSSVWIGFFVVLAVEVSKWTRSLSLAVLAILALSLLATVIDSMIHEHIEKPDVDEPPTEAATPETDDLLDTLENTA